jgi:hypothetical protein
LLADSNVLIANLGFLSLPARTIAMVAQAIALFF